MCHSRHPTVFRIIIWCCIGGVLGSATGCSHEPAQPQAQTIEPASNSSATARTAQQPDALLVETDQDTVETAEVWSETAKSHLRLLASRIVNEEALPEEVPSANENIELQGGTIQRRQELYHLAPYRIERLTFSDPTGEAKPSSIARREFAKRLRQLLFEQTSVTNPNIDFKLFGIKRSGAQLETRQRITVRQSTDTTDVWSHGVTHATWMPVDNNQLELMSFSLTELSRHELTRNDSTKAFTDITELVLGANPSWQEQLVVGMNDWVRRIDRTLKPDFLGYHGIALGDVNGDGSEDVYLCQPGGLPNLLFLQQPDGTMRDVSADAGVDWLENSTAALLVDLDNDRDQDLVITTQSSLVIMENDGQGVFTSRQNLPNVPLGFSPSASDFDLDGDLDLFVVRYTADSREIGDFPTPHPFHDARNGGANVLLENRGDFHFVDVTDTSGMGENNSRFSFAASWEDFDNDGDPDLYVANDFGPNSLLRNDKGHFTDMSDASGAQDWGFGMSVTWGDYDRDRKMDLYVSSMFSGAGNQLIPKADFNPRMPESTRSKYLKMVRGNSLLRNLDAGRFDDVTEPMAEGYAGWAWGAKFGDFNNDGWEDIYVANGYVSQPDTDDL
jgi:hypothetical protein